MTDDERLPGFPGHPRSRASLGIADLLEDGPKSVDELAQDTRAHAPALYRLLRALAGVGVFDEEDDSRFVLTPTAEYLGIDGPVSVRAWAQFVGQPYTWSAWAHLLDSIRTGEAAYDGTEPPANSEGNASSAAKVLPATGGVLPIAGLTGLVIVAGGPTPLHVPVGEDLLDRGPLPEGPQGLEELRGRMAGNACYLQRDE